MCDTSLQDQIDDATLDFTLGESGAAISKLSQLKQTHPESFGVWHALAEIYFSEGDYDAALQAGERALELCPNDIHINTSLSRIWVERGNKDKAEHFGAQARMLGWKDELKSPPKGDDI
mgnify:CR=1 FL=1